MNFKAIILTLLDLTGTRGGFVKVAIGTAGDHVFFFDKAVSVVMTDGNGTVVQPAGVVASNADCATIKAQLTYGLGIGTYTLQLSTSAADPLLLVWFGTTDAH